MRCACFLTVIIALIFITYCVFIVEMCLLSYCNHRTHIHYLLCVYCWDVLAFYFIHHVHIPYLLCVLFLQIMRCITVGVTIHCCYQFWNNILRNSANKPYFNIKFDESTVCQHFDTVPSCTDWRCQHCRCQYTFQALVHCAAAAISTHWLWKLRYKHLLKWLVSHVQQGIKWLVFLAEVS